MRLIDFFDQGVLIDPHRAAFIDDERAFSYGEAKQHSHQIANGLIAEGIRPGDSVAIYSPNNALAFLCILGVLRAGAVYVNLNGLSPIDENIFVLQNRDVRHLFLHSNFEENLQEITEKATMITAITGIDCPIAGHPALLEWMQDFELHSPDIPQGPDDLACLFSTGGTTGRSKASQLTNKVMETMIANANHAMPYSAPPVHLIAAPFTHAAGLAALWLFPVGATNVILPRADPERIMNAIEQHKVNVLFLPPTVIYMMLGNPRVREFNYQSLTYLIYGAAPMSVDKLHQAIEIFGPVLTQLYGQAEAPMMCTVMTPSEHISWLKSGPQKRLASCGRPCTLTTLAIMDDTGKLLEPNQPGEIVVRGNLVTPGYYHDESATQKVRAFNWHHTGDIGQMDEDGYLYIVDRKNDMIISGGFNIYPGEIEQVLLSLPEIQDCAVIGIPDEKWGEAVTAVVELVPGNTLNEDITLDLCRKQLSGVKTPKSIVVWDNLPRSPVGKVLRRSVRETFWQEMQRKI